MSALNDIRDIVRGVIASFFGFGGRLVARAILMVFAGRAFGLEAIGHLGQVAAISEIAAAVCVLGLKRSLLDMLSFESERGRSTERRMMEALSLVTLVGFFVSSFLCLVWWQMFPDARYLLPFLFVAVPAIVITEVSLSAVKFKRIIRWDVWSRCIIEPWTFLGLAGLLWLIGQTDHGLILAYAGSVCAACLCALFGLVRVVGVRTLMSSSPSVRNWPEIIKHSLPVGITNIGVMSVRRLDLIVLSAFVGPSAVGLYYMAQQVVTIPQKTAALFEPMLSPVMARLHNQKNTDQIRINLISVCRWIFIFQIGLTIPMMIFSDIVMTIFGSEFRAGAIILCVILVAELIDGTFLSIETPLVYARPLIPPTLLVLALVIEIVSISTLSFVWGVEGAAIGFLITMTCLALGRIIMLKRHLDISVISTSYIVPLLAGLVMACGLWILREWSGGDTIINISGIVITLIVFGAVIKTFAMTKSDRALMRILSRKTRRTAT